MDGRSLSSTFADCTLNVSISIPKICKRLLRLWLTVDHRSGTALYNTRSTFHVRPEIKSTRKEDVPLLHSGSPRFDFFFLYRWSRCLLHVPDRVSLRRPESVGYGWWSWRELWSPFWWRPGGICGKVVIFAIPLHAEGVQLLLLSLRMNDEWCANLPKAASHAAAECGHRAAEQLLHASFRKHEREKKHPPSSN